MFWSENLVHSLSTLEPIIPIQLTICGSWMNERGCTTIMYVWRDMHGIWKSLYLWSKLNKLQETVSPLSSSSYPCPINLVGFICSIAYKETSYNLMASLCVHECVKNRPKFMRLTSSPPLQQIDPILSRLPLWVILNPRGLANTLSNPRGLANTLSISTVLHVLHHFVLARHWFLPPSLLN